MPHKLKIVLLLIVFAGLALRLYRIDLPLLEFYPSRQVQTADITRNFINYDFNLLNPTVSYLGSGFQPFLIEFPGYNLAVAIIYKLAGSTNEIYGRLFSIAGFLIASVFLFKLAKMLTSGAEATIALFFFTFSPLSILISRSFQPDQWMLTFSIMSIYYLAIWSKKGRNSIFVLAALCAAISILLKLPAAIFILIPATYLILHSNSKSRLLSFFIFLFIALLPSIVWYGYSYLQNLKGLHNEGAFGLVNWFEFKVFLNYKYWADIFGFEFNLVLLPVGMILFLIGFISRLKASQFLLYFWLFGIIVYFLIFNKHNMTHEYYHLPFLPLASVFIGIGAKNLIDNLKYLVIPKNFFVFLCSVLIFFLMLPPALARGYRPIDRYKNVVSTANEVRRLTSPNNLVIGSMDSGATLVYYSQRHGWTFEVNRAVKSSEFDFWGPGTTNTVDPIDDLENMRNNGASIFASADINQFLQNSKFSKYMYRNYSVLKQNENYIIFSLKGKDVNQESQSSY